MPGNDLHKFSFLQCITFREHAFIIGSRNILAKVERYLSS